MSTLTSPSPPSLLRAASKRQSIVTPYMTTSSSTMQLTAPTVMPPTPPALSHSTLTTLSPYLTNALTATPFSSPDSSCPYRPRPTSPLSAAAFTSAPSIAPVDSQRALLDALVRLNKERQEAEARLRADVAAKVGAAAEATAVMAEEALARAEARIRERAMMQWEREQERRKQAGEEQKEQQAAGSGRVQALGWTQEKQGGEKVQWEVKEAPVVAAADDKRKGNKKEKEKEEKERRLRETSLAFSPLSAAPSASQLSALLPPATAAAYVGSALPVSLSAFRSSSPLPTTAEAADLLSPSSSLPAPSLAAFAAGAPPVLDPLLSLYAGASLLPAAPLASSFLSASSPPLLPSVQSAVSPRSERVRQQRQAAAEAARCKQRLTEAGVFVHQGALDRALGAGDGGVSLLLAPHSSAQPSAAAGSVWPVPFSSLMPDPKEKKKKAAGEKKPVAKKAGKKK